jgi:hypothetical protein
MNYVSFYNLVRTGTRTLPLNVFSVVLCVPVVTGTCVHSGATNPMCRNVAQRSVAQQWPIKASRRHVKICYRFIFVLVGLYID